MVLARVTSKGQVTVPKEIRDRLGIKAGDSLEFAFEGDRLEVRPKRKLTVDDIRGLFRVRKHIPITRDMRATFWTERFERLDAELRRDADR